MPTRTQSPEETESSETVSSAYQTLRDSVQTFLDSELPDSSADVEEYFCKLTELGKLAEKLFLSLSLQPNSLNSNVDVGQIGLNLQVAYSLTSKLLPMIQDNEVELSNRCYSIHAKDNSTTIRKIESAFALTNK